MNNKQLLDQLKKLTQSMLDKAAVVQICPAAQAECNTIRHNDVSKSPLPDCGRLSSHIFKYPPE